MKLDPISAFKNLRSGATKRVLLRELKKNPGAVPISSFGAFYFAWRDLSRSERLKTSRELAKMYTPQGIRIRNYSPK